ncbi:9-O-acetylesterase [candidate division KSB1 bacterium]|nr:9-O-acetylesterase [candidate division KSB1 bacterium]
MKRQMSFAVLLSTLFLVVTCARLHSPATNVSTAKIFGNHMVLQQGIQIPVWGKGDPGGQVVVQLGNNINRTVVNEDSTWKLILKPLKADGPFTMKVLAADTIVFNDVLVGEVWICSGQSNMEWPVNRTQDAEAEIKNADHPTIRLLTVANDTALVAREDITTDGWHVCSPASIPEFSAVGYFFGRELNTKLNVPIGLISSNWGGTVVEAWTSPQGLKKHPDYQSMIAPDGSRLIGMDKLNSNYLEMAQTWQMKVDTLIASKKQVTDFTNWQDLNYGATAWKKMKLPIFWENDALPNFDGIVRFRKEFNLPAGFVGKKVKLHLGAIDDVDITWFNGVEIGASYYWQQLRVYDIPDSLVKAGRNVIAVQVIDTGGGGGLWGPADELKIEAENDAKISLVGAWDYITVIDNAELPGLPTYPVGPNCPAVLYNGMIAPLIPYAIRGAIWYQGESNAERAYQYQTLFPNMINDWRLHWGQGEFPFLFVQLANYKANSPEPVDDSWAELREAQNMALALPNTGEAVTIDIGDADDIHPRNKQEVGRRLALNARKLVYGEDIVRSGPIYEGMSIEGNNVRITFKNTGSGLMTKGNEKLTGFAIAGADKVFKWANAEIDGNTVVLHHPDIEQPVAVRYAWQSNPTCNLYNKEGLPASPFRTDSWPGKTVRAK